MESGADDRERQGDDDLSHDYLKRTASKRREDDERLGTSPLEKFAHVWEGVDRTGVRP